MAVKVTLLPMTSEEARVVSTCGACLVPKEVRPGEAYLFQDEEMACHVEDLQVTHQPFGLRMKSSVHVHMQP